MNTVSDAFYIPPEDDDEPIFLDRLTAIIYNLGSDPSTFLVDPDPKAFEAWQESLNLESQQEVIAALLANSEKLRQNLENLVPSQVDLLRIIYLLYGCYLLTMSVLISGFGTSFLGPILVPYSRRTRRGSPKTGHSQGSSDPSAN